MWTEWNFESDSGPDYNGRIDVRLRNGHLIYDESVEFFEWDRLDEFDIVEWRPTSVKPV